MIKNLEVLDKGKTVRTEKVSVDDIGILSNIPELKVGDILGSYCSLIKNIPKTNPILTSSVIPCINEKRREMITSLYELMEEDPNLECEIQPDTNEVTVKIFGDIQKEFLKEQLKSRYDIDADFNNASTIYKETPKNQSKITINMGEEKNPYNASIQFQIEPLDEGKGIIYKSLVSYGYLNKSFQNAVHEGVETGLKEGLMGWNVTDIKVIFVKAYYDSVTSTPADFRKLSPLVINQALNSVGTDLLEPILEFEIIIPEENCGKVLYDIGCMKGNISRIVNVGSTIKLYGKVPLETSKNYQAELSSFTKGKGTFTVTNVTYTKCSNRRVVKNE
jgi:ribosomal protection tetracycline resistance protein